MDPFLRCQTSKSSTALTAFVSRAVSRDGAISVSWIKAM